MVKEYVQLKNYMTLFDEEYKKFTDKGNVAAGRRARQHLMEIKKLAHELRKIINEKRVNG